MLTDADRAAVGRIARFMEEEAANITDARTRADLYAIAEDLQEIGLRPWRPGGQKERVPSPSRGRHLREVRAGQR
jgi:hypothetical protein